MAKSKVRKKKGKSVKKIASSSIAPCSNSLVNSYMNNSYRELERSENLLSYSLTLADRVLEEFDLKTCMLELENSIKGCNDNDQAFLKSLNQIMLMKAGLSSIPEKILEPAVNILLDKTVRGDFTKKLDIIMHSSYKTKSISLLEERVADYIYEILMDSIYDYRDVMDNYYVSFIVNNNIKPVTDEEVIDNFIKEKSIEANTPKDELPKFMQAGCRLIKSNTSKLITSLEKAYPEYLNGLNKNLENIEDDEDETECDIVYKHKSVHLSYISDWKILSKIAIDSGYVHSRDNGDHGIFTKEGFSPIIIPQGRSIGKGLSIKIQKKAYREKEIEWQ